MARNLTFLLAAYLFVAASAAHGEQLKLAKHPEVRPNLALLESLGRSPNGLQRPSGNKSGRRPRPGTSLVARLRTC